MAFIRKIKCRACAGTGRFLNKNPLAWLVCQDCFGLGHTNEEKA